MTSYLNRVADNSILPLLLSRLSSRAFSQERLSEDELMSLFESGPLGPFVLQQSTLAFYLC